MRRNTVRAATTLRLAGVVALLVLGLSLTILTAQTSPYAAHYANLEVYLP